MKTVLISYYTETNSTREVCDYIQTKMDDYDITIQKITEVTDMAPYEAIIIAAPIHGMRWHQIAYDFITQHQNTLANKKVVYVALASMAYQGRHFWQKKVFKALCKPSKIVVPVETAIFGGLSPNDAPAIFNYIFGINKNRKEDQRDWKLIDEWIVNLRKLI